MQSINEEETPARRLGNGSEIASALQRTNGSTSPKSARSRSKSLLRSPSIYQEGFSGKEKKFVTEKSRRIYDQIMATKAELNDQVAQLDKNLQGIIDSNEYDYLQAYNIFVKNKEKELKGMID